FVCMLVLSVPLTAITLVMVGVSMYMTKKLAGLSGSYFVAQQKDLGELNGYIEEMMSGQKVIKVFCHEEESVKGFCERNNALFVSADNANKFANVLAPVNAQIGNISYVLCAMAGGLLALNHVLGFTIGGLVSFLTFNKSFSMPISQISQQLNAVVMALAGAERIFSLLDEEPEVDQGYVELVNAKEESDGSVRECAERTGIWAWKHYHREKDTTTYQRLMGEVVFDHVDFGYNENKIVLHDIEMYASTGQKIAFVGATGAGKTTIT
ncbi:MAG TPA: ABC transporter, partial [Lachnospiraceae bacterium]|nr:ABC transporter [Lachnospiraceae bacterium]